MSKEIKPKTIAEYERETTEQRIQIAMLMTTIGTLTATVKSLNCTTESLYLENKKLHADNAKLNEKLDKLIEMVGKNSNNSSKPPSSDGYTKPAPKSLREKSDKKPGAQNGHKGNSFKFTREPDEVREHRPCQCIGCPHAEECAGRVADKRYEVDMQVKTNIVEHQILAYDCPYRNNEVICGEFPNGVNSTLQYGSNLAALAVALNTTGMVSINRTHCILSDVFNVPISVGTIAAMVIRCADNVQDVINKIKSEVIALPIAHFDETGIRVDGKLHWVHCASNRLFTYLTVEEKRGSQGIDSSGVLQSFTGIAVHDCWSSYFKYENAEHSICCAHLLRELTGIYERTSQSWANELIRLLLRMKNLKQILQPLGMNHFPRKQWRKFSDYYDALIETGIALNPIPERDQGKRGRQKKGKTRALLERLEKHKGEVCLFATNFAVPFDNNQAERDIRGVKVKQKVSGCFRTKTGADIFADITSYTSTALKHGVSPFFAIKSALEGVPVVCGG